MHYLFEVTKLQVEKPGSEFNSAQIPLILFGFSVEGIEAQIILICLNFLLLLYLQKDFRFWDPSSLVQHKAVARILVPTRSSH